MVSWVRDLCKVFVCFFCRFHWLHDLCNAFACFFYKKKLKVWVPDFGKLFVGGVFDGIIGYPICVRHL